MAEQKNEQAQDINQLLKIRRDKLKELQENGKDPFTITKYDVTHHSTDIKNNFEELEGKTVALVGTGHIGHRVAELVHAFGAKVIAYNGFSHKADTELIKYLPMKEMMEQADIVSLHCPVTEKSKGLINKETLSYMKPTAFLINEARGPVVVSQDLADALNSGKIAGAGIDVFENEPPLDTNHPLLHSKNTIVTPHVAFATAESMAKRAVIVFDNIDAYLAGNQKNVIL